MLRNTLAVLARDGNVLTSGRRPVRAARGAMLLGALLTISGCYVFPVGRTGPVNPKQPPVHRAALAPVSVSPVPVALPSPPIAWQPITFGSRRKAEMVAYVGRHYGSFMRPTWRLTHPHVIVIHYTDSPTFQSTYDTFAADVADPELHELPGTCAHFVIDKFGTIHQLVSLNIMCRHTVGLNWTAIGIEHVGYSDAEVLGNHMQISASLRLVRWLRCRFHIDVKNVIGHNESLSSPYHHEDVPALRSQTHGDFNHQSMQLYRTRVRSLGACPTR